MAVLVAGLFVAAAAGAYWVTLKFVRRSSTSVPSEPTASSAANSGSLVRSNTVADPALSAGLPSAPVIDTNDPVQLLNRGTQLLGEGRLVDAIMLYERAAVLNGEDEEVFFNLGVSYSRLAKVADAARQPENANKFFEQAKRHYERALELLPDYGEAHNNLANVLMEQKRFDEALKHLLAAVEANPENSSAINSLGKCLALQGKMPEALTQFEKAVGLNTNFVEGRFNLANANMSLGRYDEAIRELEQVLRLAPEFELAARRLAEARARKQPVPK